MDTQIGIEQVKRDISKLVNRVVYARERIIITSHGRPKAVLVNIADYERLAKIQPKQVDIQAWLDQTQRISNRVHERYGKAIDVDVLLRESRSDLEAR